MTDTGTAASTAFTDDELEAVRKRAESLRDDDVVQVVGPAPQPHGELPAPSKVAIDATLIDDIRLIDDEGRRIPGAWSEAQNRLWSTVRPSVWGAQGRHPAWSSEVMQRIKRVVRAKQQREQAEHERTSPTVKEIIQEREHLASQRDQELEGMRAEVRQLKADMALILEAIRASQASQ